MNNIPLAEKVRPKKLSEVLGQTHLIGESKILTRIIEKKEPVNLIFWGPPGTGKTTLARIVASELLADFIEISAVTSGKKDVEKIVARARQNWGLNLRTVLFVDEIHRFNKAQQDAFLPHVESGLITLIGATTENPSFEVISPLLSRSRVLVLNKLNKDEIIATVKRALKLEGATKRVNKSAIDYLAELSGGDARIALSNLELALNLSDKVTIEIVQQAAQKIVPGYDKKGDMHYDVISAFIKSMRGGDVDAALYYLARMLQAGEDPKFVARRMVIFASEDIGLAGNGALGLALNAFMAVERIGMPESGIILSHVVVALAKAKKSRESYDMWVKAQNIAEKTPHLPVPIWLRNAPTKLMKDLGFGKGQKWKAGFHLDKSYLPDGVEPFTKD
ncbi:MAG: replication-associated recombination protein A [Candidatus Nomurabacteria bacterium]|jgi:putative ATPase|nr:replication-associated recombination protein A [Candidatus Nomurabacteria bacterium]